MRSKEFINQLPNENSLGKPITNDPEALKNFWIWFKGSKVVDSRGRPLVVYHGTGSDISEFDISKTIMHKGLGFFFTESSAVAGKFATSTSEQGKSGNVMPVYLSITDPKTVSGREFQALNLKYKNNPQNVTGLLRPGFWGKLFGRQSGDGLKISSQFSDPNNLKYADTWVAFNSTQIKSAIGNNGTFDKKSSNIIKELFEPQFRNTKKNVSHDLTALQKKAKKPGTNAGSFGYVVDTPNDPGTVTKTAYDEYGGRGTDYKDTQKIDAYYIWVKLCATNNQMSANPYLPRVYVIDDREDENGLRVPRYQMEKLYAPTSDMINSDMLMAIANQIGLDDQRIKDSVTRNMGFYYDGTDPVKIDKTTKRIIWNVIIEAINSKQFDRSQEGLLEAYQLVHHIVRQWGNMNGEGVWEDMHSGNFMIRITNIGPQLVFTDPIAGAVPYSDVETFLDGIWS